MNRQDLVMLLNKWLVPDTINDYCPNGLQVEGKTEINRIVTGVTASQALIDAAIAQRADALLVHHGYFWKGESQTITGIKFNRIKALMDNGINLLAYHLPLDVHPEIGNNVQLAKLLDIGEVRAFESCKPVGVVMQGELDTSETAPAFADRLARVLNTNVLMEGNTTRNLRRFAWCTGGGQGYIEQAASAGVDAFITGEVSEQTVHIAREMGIVFYAAGHHATERYGVKALGEKLAAHTGLAVDFIDIPNPA